MTGPKFVKRKAEDDKEMEVECDICVDNYNKKTRRMITCLKCGKSACQLCVKGYLLSKPSNAHCMYCKHQWTRDFLCKALPKSFINQDWKEHQEKIYFDIERTRFIEAQQHLDRHKHESIIKEQLKKLETKIKELQFIVRNSDDMRWQINLETHRSEKERLFQQLERKQDTRKTARCITASCRGFLDVAGRCTLCLVSVCSSCQSVQEEDHKCDENVIETLKEIGRSSQSCPKCGISITKVSGCDQMWCTVCNTAFDWKTGLMINRQIHNPHYFEWLSKQEPSRDQPREHCLDINLDYLLAEMENRSKTHHHYRICHQSIRAYRQIVEEALATLPLTPLPTTQDTMSARIKFLGQEWTEEQFKRNLHQIYKHREKMHEERQVVDVYILLTEDLFGRFGELDIDVWVKQYEDVHEYIRNCLVQVAECYDQKISRVLLQSFW